MKNKSESTANKNNIQRESTTSKNNECSVLFYILISFKLKSCSIDD
jgi:hypothetical protein